MNFQAALRIPWIYKFMSKYIKQETQHSRYPMQIVEMEDTFYLKYSTDHGIQLDIITETLNNNSNWGKIYKSYLNTCIIFEEQNGDPMILFTHDWREKNKPDILLYQSLCLDKLTKQLSKKN